jgi:type I restriction enzyme S subunit
VGVLDVVFAGVGEAKRLAEKNLANARELFESCLQEAITNPGVGWREDILKNLTSKIGSGATPRGGHASYKSEGISLVRSMNVHDRQFLEKKLAFLDKEQADDLEGVTLEKEDVLLNITGASVARCCIIPEKILPARVNQHVSIIRTNQQLILPKFLNYLLTSKLYKDRLLLTGDEGGSTRQAITKAQIESFKIAFPSSLDVQRSTIAKLDALSEQTKKLEAIYKQKLADLEELKKSVLKKAFAGEL